MPRPEIDSLRDRIYDRKTLSEEEIEGIILIVGSGCRATTKSLLRNMLHAVPNIHPNHGIYGRLWIRKDGELHVTYCAGQSYPDEIRCIRKCLIGR